VPNPRDPIELAVRALRGHDRSRRQLDERLDRAGVDADVRRDALDTLERVGYLDDERYAAGRAAALAGRGYGDAAIAQFLAEDGVPADAAAAAVAALAPEVERAREELTGAAEPVRVAARLLRKGFGEDSVEQAAGGSGFAEQGGEA